MRGLLRLALGAGLLGICACQAPASCSLEPLPEPLQEQQLGQRAVAFYTPAAEVEAMDHELLWLLGEAGQAMAPLELPELAGSLGETLSFTSPAFSESLGLESLAPSLEGSALSIALQSKPLVLDVPLQVFSEGEPLRACSLVIRLAGRQGLVLLTAEQAVDGANLVFASEAFWEGENAEWLEFELEAGCPEQEGSELEERWRVALEEAYRVGLQALSGNLASAAGQSLGLDRACAGRLPAGLSFSLAPSLGSLSQGVQNWHLALVGGVTATTHACVPADILPAEPATGAHAVFPEHLPRSGEDYGMAVALSKAFLFQGLSAAYRSGFFCREAGDGELLVALDDLLRSLTDLAPLGPMRLALAPLGAPSLEFVGADLEAGEQLFRLRLGLPDLTLDVYAEMDGAALRVLAFRADLSLTLLPQIDETGDDMSLRFVLLDVAVNGLEILHDEMLSEAGEDLRTLASQVVERSAYALVNQLPPVPLSLPTCAAGEVLEGQLSEEHVLLYFSDPFEPGPWPLP
ncbi:MAG: hypothetical protein JRF33_21750 [Deltaproteobacteria bacterium]|nr:hypothetical protein [Deltaproteobacteria bacterium]